MLQLLLGLWSQTAANNATADPAINWQEGQPPSSVNDSARAMMAAIATWFASAEWINPALTPTYVSGTQFTVAGNQTSLYAVGRRVRTFNTGGTLYGTVTASAYSTVTTVTVAMDSGSMDSGLSEVDVGINTPGRSLLGSLINVQVLLATGTYTPTPGATKAIVAGVGGGAAGGGTIATTSTTVCAGCGGGSGAFGVILIMGGLSAQSVTIGAGGVGVSGANGGYGNQTLFGSLLTLPGGVPGQVGTLGGGSTAANVSAPSGGLPAFPSGSGNFLFATAGNAGKAGFALSNPLGGDGGSSPFGSGGPGGTAGTGSAGIGLGAGGAGSARNINSAASAGFNGTGGCILVFEFAQ
ncbi:hypothetical protein [Paraburkholderia unamae]|uniref:Phage tail protein n=1 Tax=Paraburkholderia unamae TaxID=219649 RepID=A0ABX5KFK1_9BURK|nr:hypothetical protein [Paraburkholderia unamae]PVX77160.1 hypothetical protein C7402_115219 [Paraburkholderia unamae]